VSIATAQAAFAPVKDSLRALKAGQESFARFVVDLFNDLDSMREQLLKVESHLSEERRRLDTQRQQLVAQERQIASEPAEADSQLQAKVSEMEKDRAALEEELENVRSRAVSMSQTITEQKRQMADEHAQWTAELRQLRRILDKQATWIAQQTEGGLAWSPAGYGPAGVPIPGGFPPNVNQYPQNPAAVRPAEPEHWRRAAQGGSATASQGHGDPVLGSVLSQFELLQKDVARRRNQSAQEHMKPAGDKA
jgi:hypothetical protein